MVSEKHNSKGNVLNVRVLFFGAARDAVGSSEVNLSLNTEMVAAQAFEQILDTFPGLRRFGRSLLFAVNEEYADPSRKIFEGDELAVFPPVSGGSEDATSAGGAEGRGSRRVSRAGALKSSPGRTPEEAAANRNQALKEGHRNPEKASHSESSNDFFELTTHPIDVGAVARRVVLPECGATVTLDGYAREWTKGRRTLYLIYEAYPPMAISELERLGHEAHERFEIAHIGIVHRTGRLEIGETSVVIAVSAPHRHAAFEACEWAIGELKRTVPIWKKEVFEDGESWVEGEGRA
jgi:molybdopterin converting factor subunit 1